MIIRALILMAAAVLVAGMTAGEPPAAAIGMIRDLRLSLIARRELQTDPVLKPYNLSVEVKTGVARVWGTVPDRALERRAAARLKALDGVLEVVTDVHTAGPVVVPDVPFKSLKPPTPALPAVPTLPAVPVSRETLEQRVESMKDADPRTAKVRVEVRGGVVTVYRGDDDDAAGVLALRLRDVSGVADVRLVR